MSVLSIVVIVILITELFSMIVPYLLFPGFLRKRIIEKAPKLRRIARKLKKKNKEETLKNIFAYVKNQYTGGLWGLYLLPWRHFYSNAENLVDRKMFLACHQQNFILKSLLINSGQFFENDFKTRMELVYVGTIHQYYIINVGKKRFKADAFFDILEEI